MRFLVLGATGTVGSQVTRELQQRGAAVRVLTRDPGKASRLGPDIEVVKGDLLEPASLHGLFEGVDGAFLLNPVGPSESQEGLIAVGVAMTQKLKRIVYLSVQHADRASYLPHFGSKGESSTRSSTPASRTPSCARATSSRTTSGTRTSC